MGLLDDLKKQAEAAKQQDQGRSELQAKNTALVETAMRKTFKYLNDLVNQLNVLKPDTNRTFDVQTSGRFEALKMTDFFVDYRSKKIADKEHLDHIILSFRCLNDKELIVKKDSPLTIKAFIEYMREHNIRHELQEFKNEKRFVTHGEFKIPCVVTTKVTIQADSEKAQAHFFIRNVDRFGILELTFDAVDLDDNLLEEFAKFLIGQPNKFCATGRAYNSLPHLQKNPSRHVAGTNTDATIPPRA
jgi:hypothetical protein